MAALSTATQQALLEPLIVGQVVLAAQTGAIGSTTIVPNAPAGIYRFNFLLVITGTGTSTLTANAIFTDAAKAETVAMLNAVAVTATGTFQSVQVVENIATANLNYSVTLGGASAVWNLYILIERLF